MREKVSLHRISLIALYILSLGIFNIPINSDRGLLSFVSAFLIYKLKNSLFLKGIISVFAVIVAASGIALITQFFAGAVLKKTPEFFIAAFFVACVLYAVLSENSAVAKFSFLMFPIIVVVIILIFVLSINNFKFTDFGSYILPEEQSLIKTTTENIILFLPVCFLVVYGNKENKSLRSDLIGLAIGLAFLTVCILNVLLGNLDIGAFKFPYFSAVEMLSVGSIFSRLSGFVYFVFFVVSLVRVSVCLKTVKDFCKALGAKREKVTGIIICAAAGSLSFIF